MLWQRCGRGEAEVWQAWQVWQMWQMWQVWQVRGSSTTSVASCIYEAGTIVSRVFAALPFGLNWLVRQRLPCSYL